MTWLLKANGPMLTPVNQLFAQYVAAGFVGAGAGAIGASFEPSPIDNSSLLTASHTSFHANAA
jgi:hypothetical protein